MDRLCDPTAEVSAHYLIARDGHVTGMVEEQERAWHAGVGEWRGQNDVNSRSIGIELDNTGKHPFPEPQMVALEQLVTEICDRWSITPQNVIGHSDMSPGRKIDPGPRFDWARLAFQGLAVGAGHGEGPEDPDPAAFRNLARDAGFTAKVDDATLLSAVRLRFRPHATGPLHAQDFSALGYIVLST